MAISSILPRKTMRNRTRLQSMAERHDYDQQPEKTRDEELVSSYMCAPESAAEEFEVSKKIYAQLTGRKQSPKHDIIMSAPVIKCKKTPRKKCSFMAERREKR